MAVAKFLRVLAILHLASEKPAFFSTYMALVCWWGAGLGAASPVAPASCMSSALPQPCQSPCTPTPALSSGRSMKATATGTSPSTKPGLKPTSTVLSSPLASDQRSWPPFTGESHGHVLLLGKQGRRHGATEAAQPLCNSWGRPDALGMQRWCRKCLLLSGRNSAVIFPQFPPKSVFYP